ncbi:MAG TPA: hypothetical protein VGH37_17185, partial [Candidatus Acidoferrum sp.]
MLRRLVVILLAAILSAQFLSAQNTEPPPNDPLGRITPQGAVLQFLEACHAHEYAKAARYLDLRQMSPADRATKGPQIA